MSIFKRKRTRDLIQDLYRSNTELRSQLEALTQRVEDVEDLGDDIQEEINDLWGSFFSYGNYSQQEKAKVDSKENKQ